MATSLRFLGAAGMVTGSKHLLTHQGRRILVDCGLFQGGQEERQLNWQRLAVPPESLEAVILTHAHNDHVGWLPRLVQQGFDGPVYCTRATAEIARLVLLDSAHLQEKDAEYANRKGFTRHKPALPLFTTEDAEAALRLLQPRDYDAPFPVANASVTYIRAGHIVGSAFARAELEGGPLVLFGGDLGRYGQTIIPDPTPVAAADYLLVESTYGGRSHGPGDPKAELAHVVNEMAERGGHLVIPAFAIGRTQELLYLLRELEDEGTIRSHPVYIDSPMAIEAGTIAAASHTDHDAEMELAEVAGGKPLAPDRVKIARTTEESKAINNAREPSIIISSSGMLTGGRILHHLRVRLPDRRNTILFVGYQPEGGRGRRLQDGADEMKIHGQFVPVRARIATISGLSAHADHGEIMRWLGGFQQPARRTFIVHGDPPASRALQQALRSDLGWDAVTPSLGEEFVLEG
jgi:metallo-beta-lactamase family protein